MTFTPTIMVILFNVKISNKINKPVKICFVSEYSDNLSSLGTPGTRQTLYLSGEENVSS